MTSEGSLSSVFAVLLFGVIWPVATGCHGDSVCSTPYVVEIDAFGLEVALADGELSGAECDLLCEDGASGDSDAESGTGEPRFSARQIVGCSKIKDRQDVLSCKIQNCDYGRLPEGLRSVGRASGSNVLARWFAEAAHLEAASEFAFHRLAHALTVHRAPDVLVKRAMVAADDEHRHARAMGDLAARFGGVPAAVELAEVDVPDLLTLARTNAVEGCVGETWSALALQHQAYVAHDPGIRTVLAEIAADETRHAELAWDIDAWLRTRLSEDDNAVVARAHADAWSRLRHGLSANPDDARLQSIGVPRRSTALTLHAGLRQALAA